MDSTIHGGPTVKLKLHIPMEQLVNTVSNGQAMATWLVERDGTQELKTGKKSHELSG